MSNDPDQIRERIETTRGTLSTDVDTLAGAVQPGNLARRQVDKIRGAVGGQTQGNPLAAGLIAFGVGWLAASLIPASRPEQQAAAKAKEHASVVTHQEGRS
jgi:hypothetical protein